MFEFELRRARREDIPAIQEVMRSSVTAISRKYYDEKQICGALRYKMRFDPLLIEDGTFHVAVAEGEIVGCGGWSRRKKSFAASTEPDADAFVDPATGAARVRAMFIKPGWERKGIGSHIIRVAEAEAKAAGFHRVDLLALRSGEEFYAWCGYEVVKQLDMTLPDGTPFPIALMEKKV